MELLVWFVMREWIIFTILYIIAWLFTKFVLKRNFIARYAVRGVVALLACLTLALTFVVNLRAMDAIFAILAGIIATVDIKDARRFARRKARSKINP